jgi:hypothetical protein
MSFAFWCRRCKFDHAGECVEQPGMSHVALGVSPSVPAVDYNQYLPTGPLPSDLTWPAWNVGDILALTGAVTATAGIVVRVLGPGPSHRGPGYNFEVEILASNDQKYRKVGDKFVIGRKSFYGEHSKKVGGP